MGAPANDAGVGEYSGHWIVSAGADNLRTAVFID
jgi:hypothetical protein